MLPQFIFQVAIGIIISTNLPISLNLCKCYCGACQPHLEICTSYSMGIRHYVPCISVGDLARIEHMESDSAWGISIGITSVSVQM